MDGNADVVLKETRQGKTVTAAVLDVCYPAEKGSDRKDRFVANLAVNGQTLTGTTQSIGDKLPVTVKLVRKPTGDSFEFKGQISIGPTVTEVTSSDNSDLSEKEFLDNQSTDDGITAAAKGFHRSVAGIGRRCRVKLDAAADFLKSLKGEDVEVGAQQPCGHLRRAARRRADHQPHGRSGSRRGADRQGQIGARRGRRRLDHRRRGDGPHHPLCRRRLARRRQDQQGQARHRDRAACWARRLSAKPAGADWNANTGKLKLTFKRPSQTFPALGLTETIEITALVAPDKPGASDRLMLWISSPAITTTDEGAGPKLNLSPKKPPATRKAASPRTTTARSTRWPRSSRASAGTPTSRPGNKAIRLQLWLCRPRTPVCAIRAHLPCNQRI